MDIITSIAELPNRPAVYAIYGGKHPRRYIAYVGQAKSLRMRILQHLITQDSSIATGTSAVHLNPDYVRGIFWWVHPDFSNKDAREAAEVIAFEVLNLLSEAVEPQLGGLHSYAGTGMFEGRCVLCSKDLMQAILKF